jgi:hypothetical protein
LVDDQHRFGEERLIADRTPVDDTGSANLSPDVLATWIHSEGGRIADRWINRLAPPEATSTVH